MPSRSVINVSSPYPLLDPGEYVATCSEATFAWARQWKKWMARLVLEPQNYSGRSYHGNLCKFLSLGRDPERPYAGNHSNFRRLWVELNGAQPPSAEVTMKIFEARLYDITVETVRLDRNGKERDEKHWYSTVREIHPAAAPTSQLSNPLPINPSTLRTQTTHLTDQHSNTLNTPLARVRARRFHMMRLEHPTCVTYVRWHARASIVPYLSESGFAVPAQITARDAGKHRLPDGFCNSYNRAAKVGLCGA